MSSDSAVLGQAPIAIPALRRSSVWATLPLAMWVVLQLSSLSLAQSFEWLGFLEGGSYSVAAAVSGDGRVIVGTSGNADGRPRAFRYTAEGGMQDLGVLPGWTESRAYGVSFDGSVVVGFCGDPNGPSMGFRWTEEVGVMVPVAPLPGDTISRAYGVSANGSLVVGISLSSSNGAPMAFKWDDADGLTKGLEAQATTIYSEAVAVSGDGSVIVGASISDHCGWAPFRWTAGEGMCSVVLNCPSLSVGRAVSADGSTVVGDVSVWPVNQPDRGFIWKAGSAPLNLEVSQGNWRTRVNDVSADGSVVVGTRRTSVGSAFIWNWNTGVTNLQEYLASLGVELQSSPLQEANGVSDDGRTIVGSGRLLWPEAWVATIPAFCRADYDGDGSTDGDDIFTYLGLWFADDRRADVDQNGEVVVQDIFSFLSAWFSGCQ